jgi:hypothetical protein
MESFSDDWIACYRLGHGYLWEGRRKESSE